MRNSGFPDTHSTGNRRHFVGRATVIDVSVTAQPDLAVSWEYDEHSGILNRVHRRFTGTNTGYPGVILRRFPDCPVRPEDGYKMDRLTKFRLRQGRDLLEEVLSAEGSLMDDDKHAECGVPDCMSPHAGW